MYKIEFRITIKDRNSSYTYAVVRSCITIPFLPFENLKLDMGGIKETVTQPLWNGEYFEVVKEYHTHGYCVDREIEVYREAHWELI